MPGPAKPLHGAGDGAGTADLQHLPDLAYVDAKLHGGGGAQKPQTAFPQGQFRLGTLFFGQTAVMHSGKVLAAYLVYIICQLLCVPPALHESDHTSCTLTILIDEF